jgi:hypothetical protein
MTELSSKKYTTSIYNPTEWQKQNLLNSFEYEQNGKMVKINNLNKDETKALIKINANSLEYVEKFKSYVFKEKDVTLEGQRWFKYFTTFKGEYNEGVIIALIENNDYFKGNFDHIKDIASQQSGLSKLPF